MIQLGQLALEPPRISANQLGEFVFASEKRQLAILRDQKFGNINAAPYYHPALAAMRRSFVNGQFVDSELLRLASEIEKRDADTARKAKKLANNALALRCLVEIGGEREPAAGDHRTLSKNAQIFIDGVAISARPEYVTENLAQGFIAFTKLRFSKSKISADVSEIVLLILHHYGITQSRTGLQFDFEQSKVVDCFSRTVIFGHAIGRHRNHQLHEALKRICYLWPQVEPKNGA